MIRRISSGTVWEPVAGYSRAVAAGDFVFVAGCTSVADGVVVHEGDAGAQTAQAIANVAQALEHLQTLCHVEELHAFEIKTDNLRRL